MLISFIGAPCSGKTTVAAMVFASLKESGQFAEFVPEQARLYIAHKKLEIYQQTNLSEPLNVSDVPITLTDNDQVQIMLQQRAADHLMQISGSLLSTVVSDSSPISALFYMSESVAQQASKTKIILEACESTDLFFYVKPILGHAKGDSLRVHDEEFSKQLDAKIVNIIAQLCPQIAPKVVPLVGSTEQRKIQALTAYYGLRFPGATL